MFIRSIDPTLAALYEDSPGQNKEARLRGISMGGSDIEPDWLDRYRGTPLFDQAVALQQSVIQDETNRIQKNLQREQVLKQFGDEDYESTYSQRRLLELQKSSLDLELAKLTNAMGAQGADGPKEPLKPLTPALPANPTELAPLEPLPPEAPPMEAAPKLASVFERLGKELAEGDVEALASTTKTAGPALGRLANTGRAMLEHGVDTKKLMGFAKSLAPGVATGALTGGVAGAANAGEGESTIGAGLKGALGGAALGGLAHGASKLHGASDNYMRLAKGDRVKAMTMAANKGGQSLLTGEGRAMARGLNQKMPGVPAAAPAPAKPAGPRQKPTTRAPDPNISLVPAGGATPAPAPVAAPAAAPAPAAVAAPAVSEAALSPMPHLTGPEVGQITKGFRDGRTIAGAAPNTTAMIASPPQLNMGSTPAPASAPITAKSTIMQAPAPVAPTPAPAPAPAPVAPTPAPTSLPSRGPTGAPPPSAKKLNLAPSPQAGMTPKGLTLMADGPSAAALGSPQKAALPSFGTPLPAAPAAGPLPSIKPAPASLPPAAPLPASKRGVNPAELLPKPAPASGMSEASPFFGEKASNTPLRLGSAQPPAPAPQAAAPALAPAPVAAPALPQVPAPALAPAPVAAPALPQVPALKQGNPALARHAEMDSTMADSVKMEGKFNELHPNVRKALENSPMVKQLGMDPQIAMQHYYTDAATQGLLRGGTFPENWTAPAAPLRQMAPN